MSISPKTYCNSSVTPHNIAPRLSVIELDDAEQSDTTSNCKSLEDKRFCAELSALRESNHSRQDNFRMLFGKYTDTKAALGVVGC